MDPLKMVAMQNALVSILHHLEDAEHTSDPEYHSGSMDDAEEAAVQGLKQLPPVLSAPPLNEHAKEELAEPPHEEPHEKKKLNSPEDEKGEAEELKKETDQQMGKTAGLRERLALLMELLKTGKIDPASRAIKYLNPREATATRRRHGLAGLGVGLGVGGLGGAALAGGKKSASILQEVEDTLSQWKGPRVGPGLGALLRVGGGAGIGAYAAGKAGGSRAAGAAGGAVGSPVGATAGGIGGLALGLLLAAPLRNKALRSWVPVAGSLLGTGTGAVGGGYLGGNIAGRLTRKNAESPSALHKLAHELCLIGPSRAERQADRVFRKVVTAGVLERLDILFRGD